MVSRLICNTCGTGYLPTEFLPDEADVSRLYRMLADGRVREAMEEMRMLFPDAELRPVDDELRLVAMVGSAVMEPSA